MALSQKHRLALYEHFAPQLGEDVTEALLGEFPAHDGDELVTTPLLRAELAELRVDMERIHTQSMRVTLGAMGVMTALITILN